ncbi:hypothetical protein ABZ930_30180 [Streptomyces sp. NPDC046716]|uniref:hypothetical protein n=1 Tax=Streptomyces sp. NPDC046716 TaxID=3157093 RepID=UPI0033F42B66
MKGRRAEFSKCSDEVESEHGRGGADRESSESTGSSLKMIALWVGLVLCVAFIAWVAWGLLEFNHDVENPKEGGFSGWQCDAGRDCVS